MNITSRTYSWAGKQTSLLTRSHTDKASEIQGAKCLLPYHFSPSDSFLKFHQPLFILISFHQNTSHFNTSEALPLGSGDITLNTEKQTQNEQRSTAGPCRVSLCLQTRVSLGHNSRFKTVWSFVKTNLILPSAFCHTILSTHPFKFSTIWIKAVLRER